jgi:hypothetical protein
MKVPNRRTKLLLVVIQSQAPPAAHSGCGAHGERNNDMKLQLTLEPTAHFFKTDKGIPVRAGTGHTNRGTPVTAYIAAQDDRGAELAEQLLEIPGPQIGQVKIKEEDQVKESR